MNPKGYLAIVLHAHLPYVRHPEHPDFLEERWLFEALTECYLPLLGVLDGLVRDGVDFRLAVSLSPSLASMLGDRLLRERYRAYLARLIDLAGEEALRQRYVPAYREVAEFYRGRLLEIRRRFEHQGDVVGAFRGLGESGRVELLASCATHAVLPLFKMTPSAVAAQVNVGLEHHRRLFGEDAAGFWLPECAYYPGLDDLLARSGIRYFILETDGVLRGSTRPRHGVYAPVATPGGVAAFARDPESSRQVWSAQEGYPGDPEYRDFYRDIGFDLPLDAIRRAIGPDELRIATGIKCHRVTGREAPRKEPYRRARALERAGEHAEHFLRARERQVEELAARMDRRPVVVAPYDAELFGHWWFEGPEWLDLLLRKIAGGSATVATVTPSEYLAEYPEAQLCLPALSSWGRGGGLATWVNERTEWIYPRLHRAAEEMEELALRHRGTSGTRRRALAQAARELLLAQASDWPFILESGTATVYASRRLREHLDRFRSLAALVERSALTAAEEGLLLEWEARDAIFPGLDPEVFLDRAGPRRWARPREPRRVAFIAAECTPFVKVGGLADVVGALPAALAEGGLEVLVLLPAYGCVDRARHRLRPALEGLEAEMGGKPQAFRLLEAPPGVPGLRILLVENDRFFGRPGAYVDPKTGEEYADSAERFLFFTRAALEALRVLGAPIDVLHCHDHHAAAAPAFLRTHFAGDGVLGRAAAVLTVHNLGYQGIASREALLAAGLDGTPALEANPFEHLGRINLLKGGIVLAERVNVVSEGYAREVRSQPELGAGLMDILAARGGDFTGILNGIDVREWDPAADPHLPCTYGPASLAGKRECKRVLRERVGLTASGMEAPLIGMITRLVDQKGLDLLREGIGEILGLGFDLVVLGTGLSRYEEWIVGVAKEHRGRVAAALKFDNGLAHLIEAGADVFLMPSLYEPCGLNQMYSLRYGTVPVVRRTGGLADTVSDDDESPGGGNGFCFGPYDSSALVDALGRAARAFADPARWLRIVRAGMSADHSWGASASRYLDLYRDALETRDSA